MPTDDERREVAERLRGIKTTREGCGHDLCCDLWEAVFDSDYRCDEMCDECEIAALDRLADLIEPSDTSQSCRDTVACDREALLELADDVSESGAIATMIDASEGTKLLAEMLLDIAHRIRDACGVTE